MKNVFTVFKKELLDSLRDRRTIFLMVVFPLILFPIFLTISQFFISSRIKEAGEKQLVIGVITNGNAENFTDMLHRNNEIIFIENINKDSSTSYVAKGMLDAVIIFDKYFDKDIKSLKPGKINLIYKSIEGNDIRTDKLLKIINEYKELILSERFSELNINEEITRPINLKQTDVASVKEKLAEVIGGFLPYLFIIFCYMGSMYPAIDLAAGEKERGTLETLLTVPVSRFEILLGKFGVVVITGLTSALISFVGVYISLLQVNEIPRELLVSINGLLEPQSIILLLTLLVPISIFFSGLLLSLSFYAKSFKEAQSIISPMTIIIIIPAFIGLMPGMELNAKTALIPILNVSLAAKSIIAGKVSSLLLVEVYLSLMVLALISLLVCTKLFEREDTIFRGT